MTQQIIQWITPAVESIHSAGYWIAFFAALAETVLGIGLLMPGSTLILFLGALSARGYMDVGDLVWFAVAGAVLGDNINYRLGKKFGVRWSREGIWFLKKEHFDRASEFFDKHGAKSVFWGRFIPSVKELAPFIAGLVGMRSGPFMFWNILGGIGWGLQWVLTGYIFAQSLYLAKAWMSRMGFLAIVAAVIVLAFYLVRKTLLKHGPLLLNVMLSIVRSIRDSVTGNPHVAGWVEDHPRIVEFLAGRFNRNAFQGLPLTLFILAGVYILSLFVGIVEDFLTGAPIIAADLRVANLVARFRHPTLDQFFLWVTALGKWQVVLVFTAVFTAACWLWERRRLAIAFLVTLCGSQVFTQLGKLAFHRPRPPWPAYTEQSFSFPSGHATVAIAFFGFLAYVMIRRTPRWSARVNYFFAATLVVLLIGMSRIYLGVHYLSDVWSGYLVGGLWLLIGISLSQYWNTGSLHMATDRRRLVLTGAFTAAAVLFYTGFAVQYNPILSASAASAVTSPKPPTVISGPGDIFSGTSHPYTDAITGERDLPLNIVVFAPDEARLFEVFRKTGWLRADDIGPRSLLKDIRSVFWGERYNTAPMRPLFWGYEANDFCLVKATDIKDSRFQRVIRIWKTSMLGKDGGKVYVGQVCLSESLVSELVHRSSPDVDTQRDYFCRNMIQPPVSGVSKKIRLTEPTTGKTLMGDPFVTDGLACVVDLSPASSPK